MRVNVHRDLRDVVSYKLLHHLGMQELDGEQGEVGMAELMQAPTVEPVLEEVLGPPAAQARGQDAGAAVVGDDGAVVGLLDVALLRLAPLVGAGVAPELSLLVGLEHFYGLIRERKHTGARLSLGCLEVASGVIGVANVSYLAVEVDVAPGEPANLTAAQSHDDGEEVRALAVGLRVKGLDELVRLGGREDTLGLGVHLGWICLVARVDHKNPLLLRLLKYESQVVVDLVDVQATPAGLSESVLPLSIAMYVSSSIVGVIDSSFALPRCLATALNCWRCLSMVVAATSLLSSRLST